MRRWLVTGGAGFIGSHFVRYLLRRHDDRTVTVLDKLTYAGNLANLEEVARHPGYRFVRGDIACPEVVEPLVRDCECLVNFAAETHVDRSIVDATAFLQTNVVGTQVLLEAARRSGVRLFLQISTDEVYGSLETGTWEEDAPLHPNSPYAASKAAADLLVQAYVNTYRLPAILTRCSNNYGPYQYPEKFIPLSVTNLLEGLPIPLYGDGLNQRDWLFVEDHCEAINWVIERGKIGQIYHIGAGEERTNLAVAEAILAALGKPSSWIRRVPDRPGHDRRYALNTEKLRALGWAPRHSFEEGLRMTLSWYQAHGPWWRRLKNQSAPHWLSMQEAR